MRAFDELYEVAADRKGGKDAVEALLPTPKSHAELSAIADDRWLAGMARRVFQAGFSWSVIDNKWDGFEKAFHGFDIAWCAMMSDAELDDLLQNKEIVRNGQKIVSVRDNAVFLKDLAQEHGSAARFFADWPSDTYVDLLDVLKKSGSRLGGATAQYLLRGMGKDGFLVTADVVAALVREGIVTKSPTSKTDMRKVQDAFNRWSDQSGRPLGHISRVLAFTVESDGHRPGQQPL
jgi:3-methyladenine DNA glycosylase Tag